MLVLTRKVGEEIVIGDNIHLTVVAIRGDRVRLGISAPEEVVVDRQEVHERRQNFRGEAPALTPPPVAVIATTPL
ncbi:MAG TPA: carbon storage regulator CsrA [Gemmataceae bacterium]|nr:carbon storage regulator CsrA [Gemmataceae bacterium]